MMQITDQVSSKSIQIVELDPQIDSRWDAFVAGHPDGLVYHHSAWLEVLKREYDHEAIRLAAINADGQICGVLPLTYVRGLPFGGRGHATRRRLASLSRTPVAGPLASDNRVAVALVQAACERIQGQPKMALELKLWTTAINGLMHGLTCLPWSPTYLVTLPARLQDLRFGNSENHGKIKWAIKKATKQGVRVRPAETVADLQSWYELYLETMRWHATPARPYRFFKSCWDLLRSRGMMRLLLAEQDEGGQSRLLAGSMFLMFGQTVFYAFNGRHREDLELRPNDVIQWHAIHDACSAGYRYYDMGEVAEGNTGLVSFKLKWGAKPQEIYRIYYPVSSSLEAHSTESAADDDTRRLRGGIWQFVLDQRHHIDATWQRLPLPTTAALGDWFHRFL